MEAVGTGGVADEVLTSDDEEDFEAPRSPSPPDEAHRSQPLPSGAWETVHDPDSPTITEAAAAPPAACRPLCFYVRTTSAAKKSELCRITLPRSWASATVGRLVDLLAARAGLPEWDCHLAGPRGPLGNGIPLAAALVARETVDLARGPSPLPPDLSRNRRTLWMWGRHVDGSIHPRPSRQPTGEHRIHRLALGEEHVLALTSVGLVLAWGRNECGQLGTGGEMSEMSPSVVRALAGARCTEVACGPRCSGAIDAEGALWSFGANQPANRPLKFHTSWANRGGATACGLDVASVAFGPTHSVLLTREGRLWSWGYNEALQLGWEDAPTTPILRNGFQKPRSPLPEFGGSAGDSGGEGEGGVGVGGDGHVVSIACGEAHSACLLSNGQVFAWGDNSTGQCGAGGDLVNGGLGGSAVAALLQAVASPSQLPMHAGDACARRLLCLGNATLVVSSSGRLYTFGGGGRVRGPRDQDEDDDEEMAEGGGEEGGANPAEAAGGVSAGGDAPLGRGLGRLIGARLLAEEVSDVAGCEDHMLFVDTGGVCHGLGYNRYGQACPDDDTFILGEPASLRAASLAHQRILLLAAGGGCSAVVTEARESLAACCVAVLHASIEDGDAHACAQTLVLAARCDTLALAPLLPAAEACCRRRRAAVVAAIDDLGEAGVDVDEGLAALAALHRAAAGMAEPRL